MEILTIIFILSGVNLFIGIVAICTARKKFNDPPKIITINETLKQFENARICEECKAVFVEKLVMFPPKKNRELYTDSGGARYCRNCTPKMKCILKINNKIRKIYTNPEKKLDIL